MCLPRCLPGSSGMLAKMISKMLAEIHAIAKVLVELAPARSPPLRLEVAVAEEAPPLRLEVAVMKGARRRNVAVEVEVTVVEGEIHHDVDSNSHGWSTPCRTPLHHNDASGNNNFRFFLLSATPAPADSILENGSHPLSQCMWQSRSHKKHTARSSRSPSQPRRGMGASRQRLRRKEWCGGTGAATRARAGDHVRMYVCLSFCLYVHIYVRTPYTTTYSSFYYYIMLLSIYVYSFFYCYFYSHF